MKRIIFCIITFSFILLSLYSVNAVNGVSFSADNVECSNNRLFNVVVKAQSADKLSAATFEFTYDRTMIEFRGVSCDDDSYVKAFDNGNTVRVSFLCSKGKVIDEFSTIFTLEFKSKSFGNCNLDYTVSDCVNSDVNDMKINNCTSADITVIGGSVSESSKNSDTENKDEVYSEKNTEKKSDDKSTQESTVSTIDQLGFLNSSFSDNTTLMFIVGGLSGAAVVILVITAFFIGKSHSKSEK